MYDFLSFYIIHFISNNIKGLQNSLKRIKIFEYLRNNVGSKWIFAFARNPFIFSWWKKWPDELKGTIFFNKVDTFVYIGNNKVNVLDKKNDKNGRNLILVATLIDLRKAIEVIKDLFDHNIILANDLIFFPTHP